MKSIFKNIIVFLYRRIGIIDDFLKDRKYGDLEIFIVFDFYDRALSGIGFYKGKFVEFNVIKEERDYEGNCIDTYQIRTFFTNHICIYKI